MTHFWAPRAGSLYLIDSGAQYLDGTTDVTRTVHLGEPTVHMQECYTRVLQGFIAIHRAVFPEGTRVCYDINSACVAIVTPWTCDFSMNKTMRKRCA